MAAPRNSFSAHDGAAFCFCSPTRAGKFFETREPYGEFGRLHVVGEAAKTQIVPARVWRICAGAAEAAKFAEMRVRDTRAAKSLRKRVACLRRQARHGGQAIELRIVARARDGAHVNDAFNTVRF